MVNSFLKSYRYHFCYYYILYLLVLSGSTIMKKTDRYRTVYVEEILSRESEQEKIQKPRA